jgi:UDP-N-acetylmuramyl pentapeptide phosphotransferase/UDP-N-acetylglucosamine-1-phosphate transferase
MFDVILSLIIAFTITLLAIPVIIQVAEKKKLYDEPDARKVHKTPIPSLGGLGIFAGFLIATLLCTSFSTAPELQYFVAASMVIFFLGIKDDIMVLSPIKKFIGQVLATFIIVYKGNLQITSMHGFLGFQELPETFSLILTYFTILVIINSFNLIDGIDGLAGTLGIVSTGLMGVYMLYMKEIPYAVMAFGLTGSLIAFLIYNYQPAKIFMGDTGSLLVGLINAILVIHFIKVATNPEAVLPIAAAPALAFALLMMPLLDTLRVFGIRIFQRRSPFSPDRNHIHHLLLDKGLNHRTITLLLAFVTSVIVFTAFALRQIGSNWLIFGILSFFFGMIGLLYFTSDRRRMFVANKSGLSKTNSLGKSKILPLTDDAVLEEK